jgi:hypothetical protein
MTTPRDVATNFASQAANCRDLGSSFTAGLCDRLVRDLDRTTRFGRRIFRWPGDPDRDLVALRACCALNALARSGDAPELADVWPPHRVFDIRLAGVLGDVVPRFDDRLAQWIDDPPQTNEVGRSAVLLGGALIVAARLGRPIELLEIGASAGLNLCFDRWTYDLGAKMSWGRPTASVRIASDWRGAVPPLDAPLRLIGRAGCDRAPLDARDPDDCERLRAFVWPDCEADLDRTDDALAVVRGLGVRIERADAADWLEQRLARPQAAGTTRLVFQSSLAPFLAETTRNRLEALFADAGRAATRERPLARLSMERPSIGAAAEVRLALWPDGGNHPIARADWYGRRIDWIALG